MDLNIIQIFFLSFGTFLFDFAIFFLLFSLSLFIFLPQVFEQSLFLFFLPPPLFPSFFRRPPPPARRRRAPPPPPPSFAPGLELHGARAAARCIDRRLFSPRGKFYIFAPIFRSASTCMVPSLIMRVSSDRFPGFLAFFNAIHESGSLKSVCLRQVFVVGKNVYTLVLQKVMCMCI